VLLLQRALLFLPASPICLPFKLPFFRQSTTNVGLVSLHLPTLFLGLRSTGRSCKNHFTGTSRMIQATSHNSCNAGEPVSSPLRFASPPHPRNRGLLTFTEPSASTVRPASAQVPRTSDRLLSGS